VSLASPFLAALETLSGRLGDCLWAVTGSTNLALRGFPVEPGDIDIMTDESGVYDIEARFEDSVKHTVEPSKSVEKRIASHFGALAICGVRVELMGSVEHYVDGEWVSAAPVIDREFLAVEGLEIPAMPLESERDGYRELGRDERVRLIDAHRGRTV
jgi:hypothetical protein